MNPGRPGGPPEDASRPLFLALFLLTCEPMKDRGRHQKIALKALETGLCNAICSALPRFDRIPAFAYTRRLAPWGRTERGAAGARAGKPHRAGCREVTRRERTAPGSGERRTLAGDTRTAWPAALARALAALVFAGAALASGPAAAKYAAIVADMGNGQILYERNADGANYPASLTKMMTLYMTFDALKRGRLGLTQRLPVSRHAAGQAPSRLGLKAGARIAVEDAILAVVTKSANDAAVVLAEALADNEYYFAIEMTRKARQLGMTRTVFRNASGLPDKAQKSTARDIMILASALIRTFPGRYRYFSTRKFTWQGRTYRNHNRLLETFAGTDGIKTGYIRASGYHLAASVRRDGRHVLGIILGGRTAKSRDKRMTRIMERAFERLSAGDMPLQSLPIRDGMPLLSALNLAAARAVGPNFPPAPKKPRGNWGVQVGAYQTPAQAYRYVIEAAELIPDVLGNGTPSVLRNRKDGRTLHRARVLGLTEQMAKLACARLKRRGKPCLPVSPGGDFVALD